MKLIFFSKCSKFYVDFKNAIKILQNVFGFQHNCVWLLAAKFSDLQISGVFWTRKHLEFKKVFWNRNFRAFKKPHYTDSTMTKIIKLWGWSFFLNVLKILCSIKKCNKTSLKCFCFSKLLRLKLLMEILSIEVRIHVIAFQPVKTKS